jgi:hypothetical protein
MRKSKVLLVLVLMGIALLGTGCASDADMVSSNISKDAEQFKVQRRIVYINLFDSSYIWQLEGNCSIEKDSIKEWLTVTCKQGDDLYAKHYLDARTGSNTTFLVEQIEYIPSNPYRYKIVFKPKSIIPFEFDLE